VKGGGVPLENLVLVAAHAVYVGGGGARPEGDENWCLQPFQRGEPPFYIEHIQEGVGLAVRDPAALLVFSGGQTRREAGPRSEGQGYWSLAQHFRWWGHPQLAARATMEEFARDSFENLLFALCRFREVTGRYPNLVTVVSWTFKEHRFNLHGEALRWPSGRLRFRGVNQPVDVASALKGEAETVTHFRADPYGAGGVLAAKRTTRDPFNRRIPYSTSCPELTGLLAHGGPDLHVGGLPWS
jgi:hypothetical protein